MRIVKQNRIKNLGELHKEWTEAGFKASRATTQRRRAVRYDDIYRMDEIKSLSFHIRFYRLFRGVAKYIVYGNTFSAGKSRRFRAGPFIASSAGRDVTATRTLTVWYHSHM